MNMKEVGFIHQRTIEEVELDRVKEENERLAAALLIERELADTLQEEIKDAREALWVLLEFVGIHQHND